MSLKYCRRLDREYERLKVLEKNFICLPHESRAQLRRFVDDLRCEMPRRR